MRRRTLLAATGASLVAPVHAIGAKAPSPPVGISGPVELVRDWTFGRARPDATVWDISTLQQYFRFRYIYDNGQLDRLPSYWSRHREHPQGDLGSTHALADNTLILKAFIPHSDGLHPGGIFSGRVYALPPETTGMVVEMHAKLPRGLGVWPAFWRNPGVEYPNGTFSALPWPPEIDSFEFFVGQHRTRPQIMQ
jgi:hypothetical protein